MEDNDMRDHRKDQTRDPTQERETRRPDYVARSGRLSMPVWFKERDGKVFPNWQIEKRIPDDDGGWRSTTVFGERDLHEIGYLAFDLLRERDARQRSLDAKRDQSQNQSVSPENGDLWHDRDRTEKTHNRHEDHRNARSRRGTRRSKPRDRSAR